MIFHLLGTAMCQRWHWRIPYFSLMKVKILPPRKLLFSILPIEINEKLMFPLCRTCAENEHKGNCTCPHHSHALIHTWCTTELTLTINMGYVILEIYCCTGPPMKKSMVVQVGEDFSLSTSTCFSTSRHKPVDILMTSASSSRDSGMSKNIHPRKGSYWTLNS